MQSLANTPSSRSWQAVAPKSMMQVSASMTRTIRAASARAVNDSGAPVSHWLNKQPTASAPAISSPATRETNQLAFISRTYRPVSAVVSQPTTFT